MGEEPDGKHAMPEDYAALYLQWAMALHKVDPKLKLGGPIFEGVNEDIRVWPDSQGRTSWMCRFVDYLKAHNRLSDLAFVSFEHYPRAVHHHLENSLQRAATDEAHPSGMARRRRAERSTPNGDGESSRRQPDWAHDYNFRRVMAGG